MPTKQATPRTIATASPAFAPVLSPSLDDELVDEEAATVEDVVGVLEGVIELGKVLVPVMAEEVIVEKAVVEVAVLPLALEVDDDAALSASLITK